MESIMESMRKNPGLYLTEGILFIILGIFAIIAPIVSTIAIAYILGWVLLIGGIYRFFRSIVTRKDLRHFWLSLISGIVAAVIGVLFLSNLITGIYLLTLTLAAYFFIDGIVLISQSFISHGQVDRGWVLFSGIITLILAILIFSGMPFNAVWIPGLLLGINLIMSGFSLTYLAANARIPAQKYGI